MFTLIENGELYAPEPLGCASVLLVNERIARIGVIERRALEALGVELDVIDAGDCYVMRASD